MTGDQLKKSILQSAIEGKLVPQDPADEPAEALLKRIRSRKRKLFKEGKLKKYVESRIYKGDDGRWYERVAGRKQDEEVAVPFELPAGWAWARLGEVGDWGAGATPPRIDKAFYDGTIPWLKTGELNNSYIYDSEEHISEEALKSCSLRYNREGDILIAMYGATIGKLGIAGVPLTTNQACCACTPYEGVYNLYLFYFLMSQRNNFIKMAVGGAQPNISKEKIIRHLIPIPPLAEQCRIAERVEAIFAAIDGREGVGAKPLLARP